jgi:hypothetical protein
MSVFHSAIGTLLVASYLVATLLPCMPSGSAGDPSAGVDPIVMEHGSATSGTSDAHHSDAASDPTEHAGCHSPVRSFQPLCPCGCSQRTRPTTPTAKLGYFLLEDPEEVHFASITRVKVPLTSTYPSEIFGQIDPAPI